MLSLPPASASSNIAVIKKEPAAKNPPGLFRSSSCPDLFSPYSTSSHSSHSALKKTGSSGTKLLIGGALIAADLATTTKATQTFFGHHKLKDNVQIEALGEHVVNTLFEPMELTINPIWGEIFSFYQEASAQERLIFLQAIDKKLSDLKLKIYRSSVKEQINRFVSKLVNSLDVEELDLSQCSWLSEYLLPALQHLPVKTLNLSGCYLTKRSLVLSGDIEELNLSNDGLSHCKWNPEIEYQENSRMKDDYPMRYWLIDTKSLLESVLKQTPNLKVLDLRGNDWMTTEIEDHIKKEYPKVNLLSEGIPILEQFKKDFYRPPLTVSIPSSEQSIKEFGQHIAQNLLKSIPKSPEYPKYDPNWEKIRVFFYFASEHQSLLLRTIEEELNRTSRISSVASQRFAMTMTDLYSSSRDIDLSDCPLLSSHILHDLQNAATKKLTLSRCHLDDDKITGFSPSLEVLDLSDHALTKKAMKHFIQHYVLLSFKYFSNLKTLDVRRNPWLTVHQVAEINKQLPGIQILSDFDDEMVYV